MNELDLAQDILGVELYRGVDLNLSLVSKYFACQEALKKLKVGEIDFSTYIDILDANEVDPDEYLENLSDTLDDF